MIKKIKYILAKHIVLTKHIVLFTTYVIFTFMVYLGGVNDSDLTVCNIISLSLFGIMISCINSIIMDFDRFFKILGSLCSSDDNIIVNDYSNNNVLKNVKNGLIEVFKLLLGLFLPVFLSLLIYGSYKININISNIIKTPTIVEELNIYAIYMLIVLYWNYLTSWLINFCLEDIEKKHKKK